MHVHVDITKLLSLLFVLASLSIINLCIAIADASFALSAASDMLAEDGGVDFMVTITPTYPAEGSEVSISLVIQTMGGTATSM